MYTLAELTERAGRALDALGVRAGNRRVRQRPDARTVRYYTQHGLVDRPLPVGGREARYGGRHLAQVVAVKRLQAAGVSLADIQRRLAGASWRELLAAIGTGAERALDVAASIRPPLTCGSGLRVDDRPADRARDAAEPTQDGATPAGGSFWRTHPAVAEPDTMPLEAGRARTAVVLPLADGVEVSVEVGAGAEVADVDLELLRSAARPLLDQLHRLGLPTHREEGTSA
ncbi:MAG: MerR family transcriptional regulator [Streptosporangiales bacterium]|nr:MerR family transcriptional regulator [Streptosporangiales bacterium]